MSSVPWVEEFRPYLHRVGHGQLAPALVPRVDLSGVVQETLAACADLPAPADPDNARRFLLTAFTRNLYDAVRYSLAAKRDARRDQPATPHANGDPLSRLACLTTPSVEAVRRETEARLAVALSELPEDQRRAVFLHHLVELSVSETAKEMGVSVASAAGHLRRGLAELRKLMADPPTAG